jgi:hypothetical protein
MKAAGPLNDTTRDACDKTANLYEAAGYPPWMGYLVLENDTIVARTHFVRRRGTAKSRLRISLFQNLRAAVLPLKWRHLIQIVKDTEPGTGFLRLRCLRKTVSNRSCRNWDSVSPAKRVTKKIA